MTYVVFKSFLVIRNALKVITNKLTVNVLQKCPVVAGLGGGNSNLELPEVGNVRCDPLFQSGLVFGDLGETSFKALLGTVKATFVI